MLIPRNQKQRLVGQAKEKLKAFASLYDLYFPKIFRYVAFRVGDRQDVEDLVSEIFEKSLRNFQSFRHIPGANVGSWLFRIAHNSVVDYYKKNQQRKNISLDRLPEIEASEILASDKIRRQELFRTLQKLIGALPEKQAATVSLRFFGEQKNWEIAQILGVSEKTVASNLCRALRTLHKRFKELQ